MNNSRLATKESAMQRKSLAGNAKMQLLKVEEKKPTISFLRLAIVSSFSGHDILLYPLKLFTEDYARLKGAV